MENNHGLLEIKKGGNTFLKGDNMNYLRWCKSNMMFKHFHYGIVDPPYGIGVGDMNFGKSSKEEHENRTYETGNWDNGVPTQEYWDLLWYCCQNVIVWGGNYFLKEWGRVTDNQGRMTGMPSGRCFFVWDKKKYDLDFADGEVALTTIDKNAKIIAKARNGKTDEFDGEKRHPTQKPVYVYDYIYTTLDIRNKRILDTHGGSMSHAVAAHRNMCNLTIIESMDSYFKSGVSNFEKAIAKGLLF